MLYSYGVTPLAEDHFAERCADIVDQVKDGVICMPLFIMKLVPEGNPVWDKISGLTKLFAQYRDVLKENAIESGILIQASFGHGYPLTDNPFQKYVNLTDGKEEYICCPEDEAFIEHFTGVIKRLAQEHPAAIMLDDDFRLLLRPGKGCACSRHMQLFNEATGLSMTRKDLWSYIATHSRDDISSTYTRIQNESLMKAIKVFREAVDSVDPSIQGINCTSGHVCEESWITSAIFCGKGNPTMVRVPNGIYAPLSVRGFSTLMRNTVICSSKLRKRGVEHILAETDTIPFNRYAKSARYLHAHYTAAIMDGCEGAKHWLTRTSAYEPESGKSFRKILSEHNRFYEALIPLSKQIRWVGIGHVFAEAEYYRLKGDMWEFYSASFITRHLERMGIPFYFTEEGGKATFLEGHVVQDMTDEQLIKVFNGSVLMTAEAAEDAILRGYKNEIGISIAPYEGETIQLESFTGELDQCCTPQKSSKLIVAENDTVEVLSYNIRRNRDKAKIMSPAVTRFHREAGKQSVVFCGNPDTQFNYVEGFSFLNESRKAQLVGILKDADALPIYCVGDAEICFRAGYVGNSLIACVYPLGDDTEETLCLYLDMMPSKIMHLQKDGTYCEIAFTSIRNNIYEIDVCIEAMYPIILRIEFE